MSLCSVCSAISFANLPPFREEQHGNNLTGLQYVHPLLRERAFPRDPAASSVRHHKSIEHLQEAAAAGCVLCALIQDQLHLLLSEIDGLDEETKKVYQSSYQPTVDLWLAGRPYGGQGFWVLSESIRSTDERMIIPIAAFSFAVAEGKTESDPWPNLELLLINEDDALADTIYARPVQQIPEVQALRQLLEWDMECKENHECCQTSRAVPRYLVDVGQSESEDSVKIVQLGAEDPAEYTALSYISDGSSGIQWKSHNPEIEESNISTTDLPRMFQDAILVTRRLNVRYIWIDSLCIPGNPLEWERDSEEIGSVYENAYLTLSATGAEKVADGLLFSRPLRNSIDILYRPSDGRVNGTVSVSPLPLSKEMLQSYTEMPKEPMSKDLWSFPDRVLSRRIVHFASDQMYFECLGCFRSEDGLLQGARFHAAVETLTAGPDYYREQTALDRWHAILRTYGRREPTTPSDKLPALSNIARAFQRLLDDEYVAGFWKKSLVVSLCWQPMKCQPLRDSTAPSWSWAHIDGVAAAGFGSKSVHPQATISDTQVTLENDSKPFGNVASASIVLEAPMVPLHLVENRGGERRGVFLRTEDGHEDGFYALFDVPDRQYEVLAEGIRNSKLFALVLVTARREECLAGSCHAAVSIWAVIATPVDDSVDRVKRIGIIATSPDRFGPGNLSSSRRTVTLV